MTSRNPARSSSTSTLLRTRFSPNRFVSFAALTTAANGTAPPAPRYRFGHVRAIHRACPPGGRARAGRGPGAEAQLHRHRAPPARAAARRGGARRARARVARRSRSRRCGRRSRGSSARGDEVDERPDPVHAARRRRCSSSSLREALSLGHNYIGTEHILLGLVRENEGVAARILLDFDADAEKIRERDHPDALRPRPGRGRRAQAATGVAPARRALAVPDRAVACRAAAEGVELLERLGERGLGTVGAVPSATGSELIFRTARASGLSSDTVRAGIDRRRARDRPRDPGSAE